MLSDIYIHTLCALPGGRANCALTLQRPLYFIEIPLASAESDS